MTRGNALRSVKRYTGKSAGADQRALRQIAGRDYLRATVRSKDVCSLSLGKRAAELFGADFHLFEQVGSKLGKRVFAGGE